MGRETEPKLNLLLKSWPQGAVYSAAWLTKHGIKDDLLAKYRSSGWVKAVGRGAVARAGDQVEWTGGLYALQQLGMPLHAGGKTALEMQGYAHFLALGQGQQVYVFGPRGQKLPRWFQKYPWGVQPTLISTNVFENAKDMGLIQKDMGTYPLTLSAPERAMMEALYLVSEEHSFEEARLLLQGLTSLRPDIVQNLLEACASVKVKRLFMALAEDFNHPWVKRVSLSKVDFGKGNRVLSTGGRLHPKYKITFPTPSPMG